MKYIKENILKISIFAFIFSIAFSISIYAYSDYKASIASGSCYWCYYGECMTQTGGGGYPVCVDASSGGNQCAFGGEYCCVGCPGEGD